MPFVLEMAVVLLLLVIVVGGYIMFARILEREVRDRKVRNARVANFTPTVPIGDLAKTPQGTAYVRQNGTLWMLLDDIRHCPAAVGVDEDGRIVWHPDGMAHRFDTSEEVMLIGC